MPNFRSSLPLPSSHTECETWAAYDAAFTTLFRWCRLIATKTAWHSFNHVTWLASWAPIVRWIFQFSREHWATSPGSNGPREIHPRDWSYGFTGGTLCQNTSEATGVERVSCVGEWGQPDSRLHSWTFCALWLIFHPMMCVLTCPRKYANGCAIWCRATVIAVFLSFSWMAMHTLAWTRSLAFGMPMLPPSQLLLAWQTQRWRTPTARSCANSPSVTTCVSVTRSFAVAPRSILMMGFALLGLIISYSPKAFVAKSSPVKYGIVLEMRYRSSTVMPGEITDRWSLASTSSFATAKRSTREWHGTMTNCTAAYGALASQHSCMMWSPNCEVSNGMHRALHDPIMEQAVRHFARRPGGSDRQGHHPELAAAALRRHSARLTSFVTTLRTPQKSAMPLRNANPLQKQSAKSSAASGMISKPILWLKSPKLGGDETLLQPGSFHELWVGREWARRGGKWPLLPRLSLTKPSGCSSCRKVARKAECRPARVQAQLPQPWICASLMLICARAAFLPGEHSVNFAMPGYGELLHSGPFRQLCGECCWSREEACAAHGWEWVLRSQPSPTPMCPKASSCCMLACRHHGRAPRAGIGVALLLLPRRVQSPGLVDFGFYTHWNHWARPTMHRSGSACPKPTCGTTQRATWQAAGESRPSCNRASCDIGCDKVVFPTSQLSTTWLMLLRALAISVPWNLSSMMLRYRLLNVLTCANDCIWPRCSCPVRTAYYSAGLAVARSQATLSRVRGFWQRIIHASMPTCKLRRNWLSLPCFQTNYNEAWNLCSLDAMCLLSWMFPSPPMQMMWREPCGLPVPSAFNALRPCQALRCHRLWPRLFAERG